MVKNKWKNYTSDKWKSHEKSSRWFPRSISRLLVARVYDEINDDFTNIYLEYNNRTGKVNKIINVGQANQRKIIIRIKNEKQSAPGWTREYVITPDKDGEDRTSINHYINVKEFYLTREKGKWELDSNTEITISDDSA